MIKTIIVCLLVAAIFPQEPKVSWFDDFLGMEISNAYALSLAGTGNAVINQHSSVGGIVALYALSSDKGAARMRLGEDIGNSFFDVRNFLATKNLKYRSRVFLNRTDDIQATIGFTGLNDPDNVLALIYKSSWNNQTWVFQTIRDKNRLDTPINFLHKPGERFTVRIEVEWGETPIARVFINDEEKAAVQGDTIPNTALCAEYQVWNVQSDEGTWSQPTLYVDYLSITQDR